MSTVRSFINARTQLAQLIVVIAIMALVTAVMLAWTKRLGWW